MANAATQHAGSRGKSKLVLVDLAGSERGRTSSIYTGEGKLETSHASVTCVCQMAENWTTGNQQDPRTPTYVHGAVHSLLLEQSLRRAVCGKLGTLTSRSALLAML